MGFLGWLENTGFSVWVRDSNSPFAYTLFLFLHSIGMAFLVGLSGMIALRVLGVARQLPLAPMAAFFPLIIIAFWVNATTGLVLLAINASEFLLETPIFYVKLAAIAGAVVCLRRLKRLLFAAAASPVASPVAANARIAAAAMLGFWTIAVIAGRLTAYVSYVVLSTIAACLVIALLVAVVALLVRAVPRRLDSPEVSRQEQ